MNLAWPLTAERILFTDVSHPPMALPYCCMCPQQKRLQTDRIIHNCPHNCSHLPCKFTRTFMAPWAGFDRYNILSSAWLEDNRSPLLGGSTA